MSILFYNTHFCACFITNSLRKQRRFLNSSFQNLIFVATVSVDWKHKDISYSSVISLASETLSINGIELIRISINKDSEKVENYFCLFYITGLRY